MSTAPETTSENSTTRLKIVHLRCLICYPEWISGGTYAVCGHLLTDPVNRPEREHCVVCESMDERHFARHYSRGEIPPERTRNAP